MGFIAPSTFSALQLDDYNPDLSGIKALKVYDKMLRSDGQVRAIRSVIGLPIRSTKWYVEPAKGAGASEKEAAELIEADLMGGMQSSFDDLLRELLRAVYMGVAVPEIEWGEIAGRTCVYNVESRNPSLIERWLYDAEGKVAGYLYAGSRATGEGPKDVAPTLRYERVAIPLARCIHAAGFWPLLHRLEQEGLPGASTRWLGCWAGRGRGRAASPSSESGRGSGRPCAGGNGPPGRSRLGCSAWSPAR